MMMRNYQKGNGSAVTIYGALNSLLNSGPEKLPASCLGVIAKNPDAAGDFDVRWRLLSGKITTSETRVLLSEAVAIFHDPVEHYHLV